MLEQWWKILSSGYRHSDFQGAGWSLRETRNRESLWDGRLLREYNIAEGLKTGWSEKPIWICWLDCLKIVLLSPEALAWGVGRKKLNPSGSLEFSQVGMLSGLSYWEPGWYLVKSPYTVVVGWDLGEGFHKSIASLWWWGRKLHLYGKKLSWIWLFKSM